MSFEVSRRSIQQLGETLTQDPNHVFDFPDSIPPLATNDEECKQLLMLGIAEARQVISMPAIGTLALSLAKGEGVRGAVTAFNHSRREIAMCMSVLDLLDEEGAPFYMREICKQMGKAKDAQGEARKSRKYLNVVDLVDNPRAHRQISWTKPVDMKTFTSRYEERVEAARELASGEPLPDNHYHRNRILVRQLRYAHQIGAIYDDDFDTPRVQTATTFAHLNNLLGRVMFPGQNEETLCAPPAAIRLLEQYVERVPNQLAI